MNKLLTGKHPLFSLQSERYLNLENNTYPFIYSWLFIIIHTPDIIVIIIMYDLFNLFKC